MKILNIRPFLTLVAIAAVGAAQAYSWNTTTGGDLGDSGNWSGSGPNYEINKKQSAPLTLASDMTMDGKLDVKMDNSSGVYTNLFDATLTVAGANGMEIWAQAGWHQIGGGLTVSGGNFYGRPSGQGDGVWFDGADMEMGSGKSFYIKLTNIGTTDSPYVWSNGASLSMPNGVFMYEGGSPYVQVVFTGAGTSLSLKQLQLGRGDSYLGAGSRMTITEGATATATGYVNVGENCGNGILTVSKGATLSTVNFYLAKGTSAKPAVTNNFALIDGATFSQVGSDFVIGQLPGTQGNVFCATNGATVTLNGGASGMAYIGKNGANNRMIVVGEGTTASMFHGNGLRISEQGEFCGTNALIVTDHAKMSIPNGYVYVGYSADNNTSNAGEENRVEVRDGGDLTVNALRIYPKSRVILDGGTLSVTNSVEQWRDSIFSLSDATLNLRNASTSYLGGPESLMVLTNSTVVSAVQLRVNGSNFVCRVHNSTLDLKNGMEFQKSGNVYQEKLLVFSGAKPRLQTTAIAFRMNVTFRFEIPEGGFDTDEAVVETTHTDGFKYDNIVGPRSVVVSVSPKCVEGTYTLLKGVNATADWITTTVEPYDAERMRVNVLKTTNVNDVPVLQVQVRRRKGFVLIFR